ncbi:hypothetical protein L1264_13840 [Pseudoalteromonas sp. APAL1]|jgi:hypothetical protein|uniref:hypothetical protein n=1 Tax=Pseudoalteromonas TaxID=53246 RepID=UPI000ED43EFA|nr:MULTISPECIES: hypothetical protein [unclassified Pseudoalteromonas]MCF2901512.1 hypothetical protein [Pseudoalteromonas sp. OFAV1]MCF2921556.1 hypothetical protein [Pseudoalteromonas sp. APAL1]HCV05272.1 hypothetical protein [Pseudoalteromonas sp.]|tara:strand:- start:1828 stop:2451 length:624 start_codon:yes stop_codon:yes gene_type:complete
MKKLLYVAAIGLALTTTYAMAKDSRELNHNFAVSGASQLEIDFPVGSLEVENYDGSEVVVTVRIEPKNDKGWFGSEVDLSDIELSHSQSAGSLNLKLDNDDIQQSWYVKMPKSMAIDVELGVGDIEINDASNSVDIELGVGAVRIDSALDDYKRIELDTGVGDTKIRGLKNDANTSRKVVSSHSSYRGNGQYAIDVEVGVGDIKVTN